jgi:PAS domain S-box-containing protein
MIEWSGFLSGLTERASLPSPSTPADRLIFTSFQKVLSDSLAEPATGPEDSQDDEAAARLIGAGRELAAQLREEGQSLAVALAAQARVREELLALCFRSFADSAALRQAVAEVLRLADGLSAGMVSEWLRLQTMLHRRRHKEARRHILREKKRYDTVFRRMNEPAFVVDGELQLVDVNPAFEKFFGLAARECVGSTCMTIIGHGYCPICPLPEVIRSGGSFSDVEVTLELPCGGEEAGQEKRTVRLAGTSLGTEEEGAGAIIILQDITKQKRVEAELMHSEEKFRSLVENLPDLIWRADRRGRLLFVSSNSARILGIAAEDLHDGDRFARIHPEDVDAVRDAYAQLWEGSRDYNVQYRFLHGDGSWIWLHDRAAAVGEEQGRPFADGLSWDITEFKNVEEELDEYRDWLEELVDERTEELQRTNKKLKREIAERNLAQKELLRMTASLQRSNADLEQFAYVASHDLREPLMLVTAFAERLRQHAGDGLDERGRGYVERIIKSADTLRELVDALLQLSRVSTSTTPFEPVDLNRLVLEVLEGLEEPLARSDARVEIGPLPVLHGDPVQIRQLFQNLISNALKYRLPDVAPLVQITGRLLADGVCEITVADNGIGMEEKDLERIFEPFVRLHGRGVFDGSGMGLTTCRKIVTRHGGEIKAWSRPGQGAAIVVRLPVHNAGDEELVP